MKKIINVADLFEADTIISLLSSQGIIATKIAVGGGGYTTITGNYSTAGYDIMVDEKDINAAKEIIEELYSEEDVMINEIMEGENRSLRSRKGLMRIIFIFILIFNGLFIIGSVILQLVDEGR